MQSPIFAAQQPIEAPWTPEEHDLFLEAYLIYGSLWPKVAEVVYTRNAYQVSIYANWLNYQGCLPPLPLLRQIHPVAAAAPPLNSGTNQAVSVAIAESKTKFKRGPWTDEEHKLFVQGFERWGKGKWTKIASIVKTRSPTQIASHSRTYLKMYGKPSIWTKQEHELFLGALKDCGNDWKCIAKVIKTRTASEVEAHARHHVIKFDKIGWSGQEHERFLKGIKEFGKGDWHNISKAVKTKTRIQVVSHAQYYFSKLDEKGSVSGTKRKAPTEEARKETKKLAASIATGKTSTKSAPQPQPKASEPTPEVAHSSSTLMEALSVPSAPSASPPADSATPEPSNEIDAEGNSTLDLHPPSIKVEDVGDENLPQTREKAQDTTELSDGPSNKTDIEVHPPSEKVEDADEEALSQTEEKVQDAIQLDPEDVVIIPALPPLGSIAMGLLLLLLLAVAIFVHLGSEYIKTINESPFIYAGTRELGKDDRKSKDEINGIFVAGNDSDL